MQQATTYLKVIAINIYEYRTLNAAIRIMMMIIIIIIIMIIKRIMQKFAQTVAQMPNTHILLNVICLNAYQLIIRSGVGVGGRKKRSQTCAVPVAAA